MNSAHLHLIVNHLPVVGFLFAIGLLVYASLLNSYEVKKVALGFVFVTALSTLPAYFTGEGAEDTVERLPGISESLIENHEEKAEIAIIATQITGLLSLVGLIISRGSFSKHLNPIILVVLISAVGSAATLIITANSGGQIRHSEITKGSSGGISVTRSYRE